MGFILSKFKKSKPSIKDSLESIDKELKGIQRFQVDTELQQKRIIGQLILFSCLAYLLFAVCVYLFAPASSKWNEQLKYALPFVIFPFIVWLVRKVISWWFQRKIVRNKEKSEKLKKDRQQLLDDVMEKETFKVAKEILEKYAPVHLLPKYLADQRMSPLPGTPISRTPNVGSYDGLRRRGQSFPSTPMLGSTPRMIRPTYGPLQGQMLRQLSNTTVRPAIMPAHSSGGQQILSYRFRGPQMGALMPSYMLPLPPTNPLLYNRKSGWMDKLVDYVIGDGAANRYALICRYCATHNGLAPEEEFPYIGYRCISCRQYNPPKKVRPTGPTLPRHSVVIEELESSVNKTEDDNGAERSESVLESESSTAAEERAENSETESEKCPVVELASSTEGSIKSDNEDGEVPGKDEFDQLSDENQIYKEENQLGLDQLVQEENETVSSKECTTTADISVDTT